MLIIGLFFAFFYDSVKREKAKKKDETETCSVLGERQFSYVFKSVVSVCVSLAFRAH